MTDDSSREDFHSAIGENAMRQMDAMDDELAEATVLLGNAIHDYYQMAVEKGTDPVGAVSMISGFAAALTAQFAIEHD